MRSLRATAAGLLLVLVAGPPAVLAHAELVSSTPANGAVLTEAPTEIVLTYSQGLDEGSSIVLKDAAGTEVALAVPAGVGVKEMRATFAPLAPGQYTIESTTKSSEDGEIDRVTVTFSVTVPATPPPAPPTPTPAPSEEPTASPAASPTPTPTEAPSPAPSAAGGGGDSSSDVIIPIAVVGLLIGGGLAFFLRRRGGA